MMGTIRVDYDNARAEANKLLSAADDCERVVRQLRAASRSIPAEWEGAAADAFLIAVERRIAELTKLGSDIRGSAKQIRRIADDLEEAERRIRSQIDAGVIALSGSIDSHALDVLKADDICHV